MHGATCDLVVVVMLVDNTILRASAMCEAAITLIAVLVGNREGEIGRWMSMNIRWNGTQLGSGFNLVTAQLVNISQVLHEIKSRNRKDDRWRPRLVEENITLRSIPKHHLFADAPISVKCLIIQMHFY